MRLASAIVLIGMAFSTAPAMAEIISIRSNDFESGKDISNAGLGLTMSFLSSYLPGVVPFRREAVLAHPGSSFSSPTGARGLSNYLDSYQCYSAGYCSRYEAAIALELLFDRPVDFVEIGARHTFDAISMIAFNSAGEIIASGSSGAGMHFSSDSITSNQVLSLTRSQSDIARVWLGDYLPGQAGVSVHSVSYTSIPEPGTLALFGLGLAGIGVARRKRAAAVPSRP